MKKGKKKRVLKGNFEERRTRVLLERLGDKVDVFGESLMANTAAINEIKPKVFKLSEDMEIVKSVIKTMGSDIQVLKSDVSVLKTDMKEVKGELRNKTNVSETEATNRRVYRIEKHLGMSKAAA